MSIVMLFKSPGGAWRVSDHGVDVVGAVGAAEDMRSIGSDAHALTLSPLAEALSGRGALAGWLEAGRGRLEGHALRLGESMGLEALLRVALAADMDPRKPGGPALIRAVVEAAFPPGSLAAVARMLADSAGTRDRMVEA